MSSPAVGLPASLTLDAAAQQFATHLFSTFPVVDDAQRVVGIVTIDQVRSVAAEARDRTRVEDVMTRDPDLLVDRATPLQELMAEPAFADLGRAVVVDRTGIALGVVSITDLQRRMRARDLAPAGRRAAA
jgi:predicted transcriptional regulator